MKKEDFVDIRAKSLSERWDRVAEEDSRLKTKDESFEWNR